MTLSFAGDSFEGEGAQPSFDTESSDLQQSEVRTLTSDLFTQTEHNRGKIYINTCETSPFNFRSLKSHLLLGRKAVTLRPSNELARKPGWTFSCPAPGFLCVLARTTTEIPPDPCA